jgi:hypothetical protein
VGFHVDTNILSAKSHNCGISSFLPNFTSVRGIDDRYLLFFVCVLPYVAVNTLFQRGYFCGIEGCQVGQIHNQSHYCTRRNQYTTKNPTFPQNTLPQDEPFLHRPTPCIFALTLHGNIHHGPEYSRVFLLGILVLSVMWDVVWDSMLTLTYYLQNPTIVGFPHFSQISSW